MSERRACQLVNQPRGTQRYQPTQREDEDRLTQAIVSLASEYGRYGYRRITALLQRAGWQVGKDRVERIWRREGLKVPQKQKPRGRLWLNDGSCVRLRPERKNHVWSYGFVSAKTHDGRTARMLSVRSMSEGSSSSNRRLLRGVEVSRNLVRHNELRLCVMRGALFSPCLKRGPRRVPKPSRINRRIRPIERDIPLDELAKLDSHG